MSDKIKTLSAAIRIGATFRPQCRGHYFDSIGSCALGAAYEACTGETDSCCDSNSIQGYLTKRFGVESPELFNVITENDHWKYTREQIAARLEKRGL